VQLSDTTGAFEATMFSDTLEVSREHLEAGSKIVLSVEATMEADQLKLLARSVQPIDGAVAQAGGAGLRIYLDTPAAIEPVATVLREAVPRHPAGRLRGPISFCLLDDSLPGEVDMELGQEFPVTPQIKGALKSLEGVLMVEDL
jgi:DNA polymerase-3 subunit alpha